MTNFPTIMDTVDMLAMAKRKAGDSNAQTAVKLNTFGWNPTWTGGHLDALFTGRVKATDKEIEFIKLYLLAAFYTYNST